MHGCFRCEPVRERKKRVRVGRMEFDGQQLLIVAQLRWWVLGMCFRFLVFVFYFVGFFLTWLGLGLV